jgi:hypothetical protein
LPAAGASLRSPVPVQTHFDRKTVQPGAFAFDTVAHCGNTASGMVPCQTYTGDPEQAVQKKRQLFCRAGGPGWKFDIKKPGGFFIDPGISIPVTIGQKTHSEPGYDSEIAVGVALAVSLTKW